MPNLEMSISEYIYFEEFKKLFKEVIDMPDDIFMKLILEL